MTENISVSITVNATPQKAFDAIGDVSAWWGQVIGTATAVGDEFVYVVPDVHYSGFRVTELVPGRAVEWTVTGSYLVFVADKQEWTDTVVRFDITEEGDQTKVVFTHRGITPEVECYEGCLVAWSTYIRGSLKNLIETGTGAPVPVEVFELVDE